MCILNNTNLGTRPFILVHETLLDDVRRTLASYGIESTEDATRIRAYPPYLQA